MKPSARDLATALLLLGLTIAAYFPATRNGFIWDDDYYVTANQHLRTTDGLAAIWFEDQATIQYYPLVFSTFWIEYRLWGLDPTGYHGSNILLHAAAAILLWGALRRLRVPGALFAAVVFAVHPVHVESVAWITERKNLLSGVLYLGAFHAYLSFTGLHREKPAARRWGSYALALALFTGALWSKTVTCSLPAVLALATWWKRGRITKADIVPLLPMFALGIYLATVTIGVEARQVGTERAPLDLSVVDRVLVAGRALWFYLGKLFWPRGLVFMYPRWVIDSSSAWQYLYPATAMGVVVMLWVARSRIGRGPLVAALFYGGTLVPALGFIDVFPMVYSFVADHFQYLASIGPIALAAALATQGVRMLSERLPTARSAGLILAAVAVLGLGLMTWERTQAYRDSETLWRDTLDRNPTALMAAVNLANAWEREGRRLEATTFLQQAAAVDPARVHPRVLAQAYFNIGNNLGRMNRLEEARGFYERALAAYPNYYKTHLGLGWYYEVTGRNDLAIEHYETAFEHEPRDPAARAALKRLRGR